MRIITEVKEIIYKKGLTLKFVAQELENRLNKPYSLANLSNKLRNEKITYREMKIIADIIGCSLELIIKEK
ncbi:MAG: LLM class flavin-dependent oxidoreductase [Cyanobacteria bacterium SIG32]|nr:LLM class flavin-dependent oxidoreductase [Cyanobacteria bacterium SIG32]